MKLHLVLSFAVFALSSYATQVKIDPELAQIVLPAKADAIKRFAAQELQYHLQLITGKKLPVVSTKPQAGYCFYVGIPNPSDKKKLTMEEARWVTGPKATYIWGYDEISNRYKDDFKNISVSTNGTLYAVYDFLNKILKIQHLEPGIDGIVFEKRKTLALPVSEGSWLSRFEFRGMRSGLNWKAYKKNEEPNIHQAFKVSKEEFDKQVYETKLWCLRMRQGRRTTIPYGHAFTYWWKAYHKTHPEYFALNHAGKRVPFNNHPTWIKLCQSNPDVIEQIFQNWLSRYRHNPQSKVINLCINDGSGYCQCPKCRALGTISDREVYLVNAVLDKTEKVCPQLRATIYAYGDCVAPPLKNKVHPRAIIGVVPIFLNLEEVKNIYKGWAEMGAKAFFIRPNGLHVNIGLPLGYEKAMFDSFQAGVKYGTIGTDYDSLQNFWSVNGIVPYILAKAFIDPSKPFAYWEDEYCQTYGKAAKIVKEYFQYIRKNIWEKRVAGKAQHYYGTLWRNITPRLKQIVSPNDYIKAGEILQKAETMELSPQEAKRLNVLILENQHAILTLYAIFAKNTEKVQQYRNLLEFRIKHKNDLNINWAHLLAKEQKMDLVGLKGVERFKDYSYMQKTPEKWYFEIDAENLGSKQNWQKLDFGYIRNSWIKVPITEHWENLTSQKIPSRLQQMLKDYDGIGWYAQNLKIAKELKNKKIYLYFGAVDESCWIYVNGELAGKHLFVKNDDWKTPFAIRIDQCIDWAKANQTVVVKVQDKRGMGGIYKSVWIVAK